MVTQSHQQIIDTLSSISNVAIYFIQSPFRPEGRYTAKYQDQAEFIEVCFSSDQSAMSFRTLFHELAHATGSVDRLNRPSIQFGPQSATEYIIEEVVAELVQSRIMRELGLETDETAYISKRVMDMLLYPENCYENFPEGQQFLTLSEEETLAAATPLANDAYNFIMKNWISKLDLAICQ